jgi:hypothetical protein
MGSSNTAGLHVHKHVMRRDLLLAAGAVLAPARAVAESPPLALGVGPHLFVDDYLIERSEGLEREVQRPEKHPEPVLTSSRFGTTQPYLSVLREGSRFRLWYNHGPAIWHAESGDGVRWEDPRVAWNVRRGYGCSLVDDGPRAKDPARRYRLANWQSTPELDDGPKDDGGLYVGFSPNGFDWKAWEGNPVLRTWPEGYDVPSRHGVGDTADVFYDPIRRRYSAAVKVHGMPGEFPHAPKSGRFSRRLVGMTTSDDFLHWSRPERICVPDDRDEGKLEFYGMGGVHARGALLVGLVRVLRDDLPCDPGGPTDGIGYTALAFSRDGRTWLRTREPFLDRSLTPGAWDHAMAWGSAAVPVGDELLLYYGGYARGHKIAPDRERQIGLARLRRDRYVALRAAAEGRLLTRPFRLGEAAGLTLNADARGGHIRTRLTTPEGKPVTGFDWHDATPIATDGLARQVRFRRSLHSLAGRVVRVEMRLSNAALYGFDLTQELPGRL